jgi:hypothetical protein
MSWSVESMCAEVAIVWRFSEVRLLPRRSGGMEGPLALPPGFRVVGASWKMWAGRRSGIEGCGRRVSMLRWPG